MKSYNITQSFKINGYYSKLTICSIALLALFILWIPFVVLTNNSFQIYGWAVNEPGFNIPLHHQCNRLWLLLFSSLILCTSVFNLYFAIRIYKLAGDRCYLFGIGIFSWLFIYSLFRYNKEVKFFKIYYDYLKFDVTNYQQVNFIHLFKSKTFDKLSRNTVLYLLALILLFIGFIFILIPSTDNDAYLNGTFIFNSLSYFTHLTNIACFFTLVLFYFTQTKTPNQNNIWTIYMCSYITIVALVYWIGLFPQHIYDGSFNEKSAAAKTEAIWLHTITPIIFVWFMINSWTINLMVPNLNIVKNSVAINVFPLCYFTYAYFIPFFAKDSVYGCITNLNPDAYIYSSHEFVKNGSPFYIFIILVFGILFVSAWFWFVAINKKIVKNKYFFNNKVSFK